MYGIKNFMDPIQPKSHVFTITLNFFGITLTLIFKKYTEAPPSEPTLPAKDVRTISLEEGKTTGRVENVEIPSVEGEQPAPSGGRTFGGTLFQPGLLPKTGPQPSASGPSSPTAPIQQGRPSAPARAPSASPDRAEPAASRPAKGTSSPPPSTAEPPAKPGGPPTLPRLAEPLTRQEITLLLAMVKQTSAQLQIDQGKNIFQSMLTPGAPSLTPAVRGFIEKIILWDGLLQKFSSNPDLPIRQELNRLREIGIKLLAPQEEPSVTLAEGQEKLEALLEGGLKTPMGNMEKVIGTLPRKEETALELLQTRLQVFSELEQPPVLLDPKAEKSHTP